MRNIFKGLSWVQIVAGAGAAVTSLFLCKQIGISGSLIGAAVASVVSAVSSQAYKNVLGATAQKEESTQGTGAQGTGAQGANTQEADTQEADAQGETAGADPNATTLLPMGKHAEWPAARAASVAETQVLGGYEHLNATLQMPRVNQSEQQADRQDGNVPAAPTVLPWDVAAQARRRKKARFRTLCGTGIALLSGLAAVAVSAVVVSALTGGEGLGYKPAGSLGSAIVREAEQQAVDTPADGASEGASDDATQAEPAGNEPGDAGATANAPTEGAGSQAGGVEGGTDPAQGGDTGAGTAAGNSNAGADDATAGENAGGDVSNDGATDAAGAVENAGTTTTGGEDAGTTDAASNADTDAAALNTETSGEE